MENEGGFHLARIWQKVPYSCDNRNLANITSAKYYLLRAFPQILKQFSSILCLHTQVRHFVQHRKNDQQMWLNTLQMSLFDVADSPNDKAKKRNYDSGQRYKSLRKGSV